MRIGVVGTGHVGLVTAVTFAELGHDVVAIDRDKEKVESLLRGQAPFYEPGLQELLESSLQSKRLEITDDPARVGNEADVVFICVGTPPKASGEANLIAVEHSATGLAPHFHSRVVVVEKSTVPAGTSRYLQRILRHARPDMGDDLQVVSNPEFLREGHAIEDSLSPDRILVGANSDWALETIRNVYQPLIDKGCDFVATDIVTAELSKHACNAFLAMKISYANALARICELSGADVVAVADIMGKDQRIGRAFLNAGLGYGGFCFPKDLAAFERLSNQFGYEFPLLKEIARINDEALDATVEKVIDALWNVEGKRIALLGLTFKPETDDTRFSPPLALARKLMEHDAQVVG
ncbi:MAG TPA: UDP-glucose/GDP-mannose dehydrogenase family protein, partial [Actinomycetota bacterium]|nr:UDP-glucose/GDP-mannose dehydrogenase family protein [Actinomycetota bacterium]